MTSLPVQKRKQFIVTKRHVAAFSVITTSIALLTGAIGYQTGKKLHSNIGMQNTLPLTYQLLPDVEKQKRLEELLLEIDQSQQHAADSDYLFPEELTKNDVLPIPKEPELESEGTQISVEEGDRTIPELPSTPLPTSGWSVQVGSYPNLKEAEEHASRLQELGQNIYIVTASVNGEVWYRTRIAGYPTKADANDAKKALQIKHQEFDYLIFKAP